MRYSFWVNIKMPFLVWFPEFDYFQNKNKINCNETAVQRPYRIARLMYHLTRKYEINFKWGFNVDRLRSVKFSTKETVADIYQELPSAR